MKKIVIIPNKTKDEGLKVTKRLVGILSGRAEMYFGAEYDNIFDGVHILKNDALYSDADCVIVLGGDGTILRAAEECGKRNIPVLGINLGTVGFMTEVNPDQMEAACNALLEERYILEKRMMIEICVICGDFVKARYHALNDAVIAKDNSSMISVSMFASDEKINQYKADGLIISTPTGSTGYSLSAGGPVADPSMEILIASPICAHELHARPAVMSAARPITLVLNEEQGINASLSVDGHVKCKISHDDKIVISKSSCNVSIIKIGNQSFYDVLIDKLR